MHPRSRRCHNLRRRDRLADRRPDFINEFFKFDVVEMHIWRAVNRTFRVLLRPRALMETKCMAPTSPMWIRVWLMLLWMRMYLLLLPLIYKLPLFRRPAGIIDYDAMMLGSYYDG